MDLVMIQAIGLGVLAFVMAPIASFASVEAIKDRDLVGAGIWGFLSLAFWSGSLTIFVVASQMGA